MVTSIRIRGQRWRVRASSGSRGASRRRGRSYKIAGDEDVTDDPVTMSVGTTPTPAPSPVATILGVAVVVCVESYLDME